MNILAGKAALVTGAAQGLGKAISKCLLDEALKVCLTDIDVKLGQITLKEFRGQYGDQNVIFEKLDVSDQREFEKVMIRAKYKFGHLDILMNNAGIGDEINWRRMLQINMNGVGNGIELAQRHLCNSEGVKTGTVINTGSLAGIKPNQNVPFYSASKCAVIGLTLSFGHRRNFKKTNIKVNAIIPDMVLTNFYKTAEVQPRLQEILQSAEVVNASQVGEGVLKLLREDVTRTALIVSRSRGMYYYPFSTDDVFFDKDII